MSDIVVDRYNPLEPIEYGAMATHGIMDDDLIDCPPITDFNFNKHDCEFIIGHNIDYDWRVIGSPDMKRICTLALARKIWPDTSHKLLALIYMLAPQKARVWHKSAHGVATDIEMTGFLLRKICERLQIKTLNELYTASEAARIPEKMPFGKHEDTPINDLPRDYINWALSNLTDLDEYLRKALENAKLDKVGGL